MIGIAFTAGKWLISSRLGRSVGVFMLAIVMAGFIWRHGYKSHKDAAALDRLKITVQKQKDRNRIDEHISTFSGRDLCRRLGGGVQCDDL